MKRHPLDLLSLLTGLVFLATGATFLTGRADVLQLDLRWLWVVIPLVAGVAVLASLRPRRLED